MAWHFSTNNTLATYTLNLWQLIATMMAAGWTDITDSDGTTFNGTGGQVTSGNTGAGGLNNSGAYVVLQSPAGPGGPGLFFQSMLGIGGPPAVGDIRWNCVYSPTSAWSGGSVLSPPTATDGINVLNYFNPGSDWFGYNTTEGSTRYSCAAQDVAPYAFWGVSWAVGGGTPEGGIFYDGVVNGAASEADDPDQHVLGVDAGGLGWNASIVTLPVNYPTNPGGVVGLQPQTGGGGTMNGAIGVLFPWTTPANGVATDPTNGNDQLRPLEFYFPQPGALPPGTGCYKGQTQSILWEMAGTSASPRPLGYLLSLVSANDTIVIGQLAVPWDGSAPLI